MKRSEINRALVKSKHMLEDNSIKLPKFGYWSEAQWREHKGETNTIAKTMLGWDVTDFGTGDFEKTGATLFTIRNGVIGDGTVGTPYAEKLIFMFDGNEQEIPLHHHVKKTEDIINRGGGIMSIQLFSADESGKLDKTANVVVDMDGISQTFAAGTIVDIEKGCSITLRPGLIHRFWAKKGCGDLVAGEVSSVNDDNADNVFVNVSARFSAIEEDEVAVHPLCNEYHKI